MKFNVFCDETFYGANKSLLKHLYQQTNIKDYDTMHIIFVPDRLTLAAETEILNMYSGSMNVHVMTLRRYASTLLPKCKYMAKEEGIMILSQIISKNASSLKCFTNAKNNYGIAEKIYDVICQLKYSCISPEKINSVSMPDYLKDKIGDISLLYNLFIEFTENLIDSSDKLELFAHEIAYSSEVLKTHYYFKDFDNFSKQELNIIQALCLYAKSVSIGLIYSDDKSRCMLYLNDVFSQMKTIAEYLIGLDKNNSNNISFSFSNIKLNNDGLFFEKYFLNANIESIVKKNIFENYKIYSAENYEDEIKAAAQYICKKIRNENQKYNDFVIVNNDIDNYKEAIVSIFNEYGIPFFVDEKEKLITSVLSRFIIDFFRLYISKFNADVIMDFVNNFYFGYNEYVKDFIRYCDRFNCYRRIFTGFTVVNDSKYENLFYNAELIRKKIVESIPIRLNENDTVNYYVERIFDVLSKFDIQLKHWEFIKCEIELGKKGHTSYSSQYYNKLINLLDNIKSLLGDISININEFYNMLCIGLEGCDISTIPPYGGAIEIINMQKARRHTYKNLIILGANDGVFPQYIKDLKILNDDNLNELSALGIEIEPSIRTQNQRERMNIYQLFCENKKSLYISYIGSEDSASSLKPSIAINHIFRMFYRNDGLFYPDNILTHSDKNYPTINAAISSLQKNTRTLTERLLSCEKLSYLFYSLKNNYAYKLIRNYKNEIIYCGENLFYFNHNLSTSEVEMFYTCPYKHFLLYGVNIRTEETGTIKLYDFGNIIHNVLKEIFLPYTINRKISLSDTSIAEMTIKAFDKTINENYYYNNLKNLIDSSIELKFLKNECVEIAVFLNKEINNSLFKPTLLEKKFAKSNAVEINHNGQVYKINGIIDRVDTCNNNAIVIDYKSGSKKITLKDFEMGTKLQLTTYVLALKEKGYKIVGFYYLPVSSFFNRKNISKLKLNGWTLCDIEIINAIGLERTGLKFNKDGTPSKSGHRALNEDEIVKMINKTRDKYYQAITNTINGECDRKPVNMACEYCDYKNICGINDIYF